MGRRVRTAAGMALAAAALVAGGAGAGAQAAPCPPADVACKLRIGVEGVLAPIVGPPATSPPATTAPGTSPGSTAPSVLGTDPVAASAGEQAGTAAALDAPAARIPTVPAGQALELPPLTIPDFGGGPGPAPVARVVRPVRSEVGDALTGLARPPAEPGGDPARALAVAVGVPVVLVAASVAARRRFSGAR